MTLATPLSHKVHCTIRAPQHVLTEPLDTNMTGDTEGARGWSRRGRVVLWSVVGLMLGLPLVAMQFTDQVNWTPGDFAVAGVLLLGVVIPYELAMKRSGDTDLRAGVAVALGAVFLLIWINGAVGIIGSENNPANLMYGGVIAIAVIGVLIARFQPRGMAYAMYAAALAQASVAAIALAAGLGSPENGPLHIIALNGFFVVLFTAAAILFGKAATKRSRTA